MLTSLINVFNRLQFYQMSLVYCYGQEEVSAISFIFYPESSVEISEHHEKKMKEMK